MNEKRRLSSWKEIAVHLGVELRTAQRWEHERGLPVHRLPGGKRNAVFAYEDELETWLHSAGPNNALAGGNAVDATALPEIPAARPSRKRTEVLITGGVAAILVLGALAAGLWHYSRPAEIARVTFVGEKVIAWDHAGQQLWNHDFPGQLEKTATGLSSLSLQEQRARVIDLDGDGRPEILVVTHQQSRTETHSEVHSALHCFSAEGKLLWRYEPQEKLRFGGAEYGPPWYIYELALSPGPSPRTIWLAVTHNMWWPSFVVRLDERGTAKVQFINSGSLWSLHPVESHGRQFVLAGGVNNEPYQGALAIFAADAPPAVSPQSQDTYRCENCPAGQPIAYFLFTPTELFRLKRQPLNHLFRIERSGAGVTLVTFELPGHSGFYAFADVMLTQPVGFSLSDGYWQEHRALEKEGKLNHTAEQCPDRTQPKLVRKWTPGHGWTTLSFPALPRN
jgi:hypothetical protein